MKFRIRRRVAYYETDAMGVVHHSNYARYFEDCRVAWMREIGLMAYHAPEGDFVFAVHELEIHYRRPLRFDDLFDVALDVTIDGIRLRFRYTIEMADQGIAHGSTVIVPLDTAFRPARLPAAARKLFEIVSVPKLGKDSSHDENDLEARDGSKPRS